MSSPHIKHSLQAKSLNKLASKCRGLETFNLTSQILNKAMIDETPPKPSKWQRLFGIFKNPVGTLTDATKDSPLVTILAVVFVIQPVVSTGIGLVKGWSEVRQQMNPDSRPITKAELGVVNEKIDFLQKLVVTQIEGDNLRAAARAERTRTTETVMVPVQPTFTPAPVVSAPMAPSTTRLSIAQPGFEVRAERQRSIADTLPASEVPVDNADKGVVPYTDLQRKLDIVQREADKEYEISQMKKK